VARDLDRAQRKLLTDVIGHEADNYSKWLPIAEGPTIEDQSTAAGDRGVIVLLEQLSADVEERDRLVLDYEKAKRASDLASNKTHRLWNAIRTYNDRALQTREAIDVLKKRNRPPTV